MSQHVSPTTSPQLLHLVFGGELTDLDGHEFRDLSGLDIVGIYPDYQTAYVAWKSAAQRSVDRSTARVGRTVDRLNARIDRSLRVFTASTDRSIAVLSADLRRATDTPSLVAITTAAIRLRRGSAGIKARAHTVSSELATLAAHVDDLVSGLQDPVLSSGALVQRLARIKADPSQYTEAFIGAIPTALFVLVPILALLLKCAYLFKRRLYMEHLVVSLHSHAFLSLVLLLVFTCMGLQGLAGEDSMVATLLGWLIGMLVAWAPIYLLLMQKRVYGQGWPMTVLKYFALGTVYMTLLSFAIAGAAVASLVWM